jgi:ligand-binding sensor domain-containing protein/signal transduction histidine kinase/ActR/RegA family two-component response regulator
MRFFRLIPKILAVVLVGGLGLMSARAGDDGLRFIHQIWQSEDGLPSQSVGGVAQGRDGYLWLATPDGVARFDGARFTPGGVQSSQDRPRPFLYKTTDGTLWASCDNGMARMAGGQTTFFTTNEGLPSSVVMAVYEDRKKRLWVGTTNGVSLLEGTNFVRMPTNAAVSNYNIRALVEDRAGVLWVGTQHGLFSYQDGKVTPQTGEPRGMVQCFCASQSGALWVGTTMGLGRLQDGQWTIFTDNKKELNARNVHALYEDAAGTLWIGTSSGVQRFANDQFYSVITSGSMAADFNFAVPGSVNSICGDNEGDIWIGTTLGLNRLKRQSYRVYDEADGLPEKQVASILQSRAGDIWMGTIGGGLTQFHDGHFNNWGTNQGLPVSVRGLCEDQAGALWLGGVSPSGGEGLYCLKDGQVVEHFSSTNGNAPGLAEDIIRVIFQDHAGTLWIGSSMGLTRLAQGKFETITTGRNYVKTIAEDAQGRIWFGTRSGLSRVTGGQAAVYRKGLRPREIVNSIYTTTEGVLWFATDQGRLFHLRGDDLVLAPTHGAFTSIVALVGDKEGNLWLSADTGVFRVAKSELAAALADKSAAPVALSISKVEGIHRAQLNGIAQPAGWCDQEGKIWFPTLVGALVVNSKEFESPGLEAPVVVEQGRAGGQPLLPESRTRLSRHADGVEFEYTALNLQAPEKDLFECRLEGLDKTWQDMGTQRSVHYAGLAPGRYVFHVRAANAEGVWGRNDASFAFVLLPRFYQTGWFYVLCACAVLLAGYGGFRWTVGLRHRIQQQRDQELFKLIDEWTQSLQHEVAERKQAQKALVESQELVMRQERLAAVGQMAAGVAHEFNNILTVIQGHSALLLDNPSLDDDSIKSLNHITAGVERTAKLIRQMLAFSRKQIMQREAKDLNVVATNVSDMLVPMLGESIHVRRDLWDKPLTVLADPAMIEQALVNLAVNARDAMPKGGNLKIATREIEITEEDVQAKPERRVGRFARLSVSDTGCGMEATVIDHLFEPFFTTKDVGKGVGLGLATVYGMIQQHQGWMEVESQPGKGATFHMLLPFTDKSVEKPVAKAPRPKVEGGKETILLVEDEIDLRELVTDILEGHGYRILQAGSGVEALKVWEECGRNVDILLSDIIMPEGMSGRELAEKLQEADPNMPVILTSGYNQEMIEREVVLSDSVKFFAKPYHPAQLAQAVRESLNDRKRNMAIVSSAP